MKKKYFTKTQIAGTLCQTQGGVPIPESCREHGISVAAFYKWRSKYGEIDVSMISEMRSLNPYFPYDMDLKSIAMVP